MAVGMAMGYPDVLKTARDRLWQQSSEGQEATAKYQKDTTDLTVKWKSTKRKYRQKRNTIEDRYEQAKDDFFNPKSRESNQSPAFDFGTF